MFFLSELFSTNAPKSAAYAEERPMSDAANLDKGGREPGTGLALDKKEARGDRGTGSDASAFPWVCAWTRHFGPVQHSSCWCV